MKTILLCYYVVTLSLLADYRVKIVNDSGGSIFFKVDNGGSNALQLVVVSGRTFDGVLPDGSYYFALSQSNLDAGIDCFADTSFDGTHTRDAIYTFTVFSDGVPGSGHGVVGIQLNDSYPDTENSAFGKKVFMWGFASVGIFVGLSLMFRSVRGITRNVVGET